MINDWYDFIATKEIPIYAASNDNLAENKLAFFYLCILRKCRKLDLLVEKYVNQQLTRKMI